MSTLSPVDLCSVIQVNLDHAELEDARWFSLQEVTSALQAKALPRRDVPSILWLPPTHAIANHLITEWVDCKQHSVEAE